jgi:excisionase family DNA binding protein
MSTEKILCSRRDAAHALSISVRSLDYLIERGDLPTRRIGRKVLIQFAALQRFARGDHAEAIRPSTGTTTPS